jgi:hypothetical protein
MYSCIKGYEDLFDIPQKKGDYNNNNKVPWNEMK